MHMGSIGRRGPDIGFYQPGHRKMTECWQCHERSKEFVHCTSCNETADVENVITTETPRRERRGGLVSLPYRFNETPQWEVLCK